MKRYVHTSFLLISLLATVACTSWTNGDRNTAVQQSMSQPKLTDSVSSAKPKQQASALYFLDRNIGWALSEDALYSTRDGGETWLVLNKHDLRDGRKVIYVNEREGWAILDEWATNRRSNSVLRTQDGGRSWSEVFEAPTPIFTVDFINQAIGYATPRWQPIKRTTDGGRSWEEMNGIEGLNYVFFMNEKDGWGYGSAIWRTKDGGDTWTQIVSYDGIAGELYKAMFIGNSTGWIIGSERQVWRTTDNQKWQQVFSLPDVGNRLLGIDFISHNEGWITAEDGTVLHSTDGGSTWQVIARQQQALTDIKFVSSLKGSGLNVKGNLMRTNDGGKNWAVDRSTKSRLS